MERFFKHLTFLFACGAALLALLWSCSAQAATVVQIDKQDISANTSHSLPFAGAFTNGNLAVVVFMLDGATVSSVQTSGDVQTCTLGGSVLDFEGTLDGYAYYCNNASSSVTGFTITLSASVGMLAVVAEISGYNTTTPFDAVGAKAGSFATTSTRANVTTVAADSIAVGAMYTSGTDGFTADAGFTELEDETTSVAYYSNTGLGAPGAKVTGGVMGAATYGYGFVATFRNTAGGGGGSTAPRRTLLGVGI